MRLLEFVIASALIATPALAAKPTTVNSVAAKRKAAVQRLLDAAETKAPPPIYKEKKNADGCHEGYRKVTGKAANGVEHSACLDSKFATLENYNETVCKPMPGRELDIHVFADETHWCCVTKEPGKAKEGEPNS